MAGTQGKRGAPAEAAGPAVAAKKGFPLKNGVRGTGGQRVYVSFPGKFQDAWNNLVAMVFLMDGLELEKEQVFYSTSCVFIPEDDTETYGVCVPNQLDGDGRCWCFKLYGSKKDWGCKWFSDWRRLVIDALERGQKPAVVYKRGQAGEGDEAVWEDFPLGFDTDRPGLGASQAGEVAMLKKLLPTYGHDVNAFDKMDVDRCVEEIQLGMFKQMEGLVRGATGAQRLAKAILSHPQIQQGLLVLDIDNAGIGEEGATALTSSLGELVNLRNLSVCRNDLGQGGAAALAPALGRLVNLQDLALFSNRLGQGGAAALAPSLRKLVSLQKLGLGVNELGQEGAAALASSLGELASLQTLYLWQNDLGQGGAVALASSLGKLVGLQSLDLDRNNLGQGGVRALAPAFEKMTSLQCLSLCSNGMGLSEEEELQAFLRSTIPRQDCRIGL